MIYIKAYTKLNLGDDLLIKLVCNNNENEKFCILADKYYKEVFKDVKNLKIMNESYDLLQNLKNDKEKHKKEYDRILKEISSICDTFLYVGGSIFIENSPVSIIRVRELKNEISYFKKSYIIGANFGPFIIQDYFNCVHDEIIPLLDHITFRDKYSYNLFKDLENVSYAPDIVFTLENNVLIKKKKEIGISLINHLNREEIKQNYDDYLNTISVLAKNYIKEGFDVRFLSFCSYEKDKEAIFELQDKLSDEDKLHINVDYYEGNINEFLNNISSLDTIIATRFHSIVLALKYSCNLIPICYSNKSVNLLDDLGIKEYVSFSNIKDLINLKPSQIDDNKIDLFKTIAFNHFNYKNN